MIPIGLLMAEHRLIERMLRTVRDEARRLERERRLDPSFIDATVDFIRTYADKTHHGKEEAILFRDLAVKELSSKDRALLEELIQDHGYGRKTTGELLKAKQECLAGRDDAMMEIVQKCDALIDFYHGHIRKEDDHFFPASSAYLSVQEQEAILREFWEADRRMIHLKYTAVVQELEGRLSLR
jgi:hemerythrin-like domain-containing protein